MEERGMLKAFLIEVTTSPGSATLAMIATVVALYILLVKLFPLKKKQWLRLEFIWVAIGSLALLSVIEDNDRIYKTNELKDLNRWIENDYQFLRRFLKQEYHCNKYSDTGIWSEEEFLIRKTETDAICDWTKEVDKLLDSLYANEQAEIIDLPYLNVNEVDKVYQYERVNDDRDRINKMIYRRDNLKSKLEYRFWEGFNRTYGVLFLIVVFALRLTYSLSKIKDERRGA